MLIKFESMYRGYDNTYHVLKAFIHTENIYVEILQDI